MYHSQLSRAKNDRVYLFLFNDLLVLAREEEADVGISFALYRKVRRLIFNVRFCLCPLLILPQADSTVVCFLRVHPKLATLSDAITGLRGGFIRHRFVHSILAFHIVLIAD